MVHRRQGSTRPGDPEEDGRELGAQIEKDLSGLEGGEDGRYGRGHDGAREGGVSVDLQPPAAG